MNLVTFKIRTLFEMCTLDSVIQQIMVREGSTTVCIQMVWKVYIISYKQLYARTLYPTKGLHKCNEHILVGCFPLWEE